jgi:hypothetical protein
LRILEKGILTIVGKVSKIEQVTNFVFNNATWAAHCRQKKTLVLADATP